MSSANGRELPSEMFWWTWSGSNRRPLSGHLKNINRLQPFLPETTDLAEGDWDAMGRHGAAFRVWTPRGLQDFTARSDCRRARARLQVALSVFWRKRKHWVPKGDAHVKRWRGSKFERGVSVGSHRHFFEEREGCILCSASRLRPGSRLASGDRDEAHRS